MNGPNDPYQGGNYPPQGQGYPPPQGQGYPPPHGQPPQGGYPGQPYPPGYPPPRSGGSNALVITLIVLVVAAIAGGAILYFTGAFGGGSQAANNSVAYTPPATTTTPTTVTPPVSRPVAPTPSVNGGNVAQILALGVQQMQSQLPIRRGPATITAVSSSGTVLTMEMSISQPISDDEFEQGEASFRQNICAGQFRNAISQGASAEVIVTDSVGNSHTYNISSC